MQTLSPMAGQSITLALTILFFYLRWGWGTAPLFLYIYSFFFFIEESKNKIGGMAHLAHKIANKVRNSEAVVWQKPFLVWQKCGKSVAERSLKCLLGGHSVADGI